MTEPTCPKPARIDLASQLDFNGEMTDFRDLFEDALRALENIDDINSVLKLSNRPDLVITSPADMMPLNELANAKFKYLNNFVPLIIGTAREATSGNRGSIEKFFDTWGAKGDVNKYMQIAESTDTALEELFEINSLTHMSKPALVRMQILFPELSEMLFNGLRNLSSGLTSDSDSPFTEPEVFVAYNVMARLVDKADPRVMPEGESVEGTKAHDPKYLWN